MKTAKYLTRGLITLFAVNGFYVSAQQLIPTAKNKLSDACSKAYSGSSNQVEDCMTCAKNTADINSHRFIRCMGTFESINERKNGQMVLEDLIGNTPDCIKGVKSYGC